MGKSVIPFIFENSYFSDIFIEASISKNMSETFHFEITDLRSIKINKIDIAIMDYPILKNLINDDIKIKKIFFIDDSNRNTSNLKINSEIIKFNTPFKINDIYQRIKNDLVQFNINNKRLLKFKYFTYDPSTRKLVNKSTTLRFTEKESQIFSCLLDSTNSFVSKKDLLLKVWSYGAGIDTHTLETHVYALRKKIEMKLKVKDLILFEEKKGYYLNKSIL